MPTMIEPTTEKKRLGYAEGEILLAEPERVGSLPAALGEAAKGGGGVRYVGEGTGDKRMSYGEVVEAAERVMGGLRERGLQAGDKVLFQLERNEDFIAGLWGCFLGGMVATPLGIAPGYESENSALAKLSNAWSRLGKPVVLAGKGLVQPLEEWGKRAGLEGLRVWAIEELGRGERDGAWHKPDPDELALLLLTSGSTGKPKGVMLSHRNILSRSAATAQADGFTAEDISFNWMPLDHVGGVVMFHLRDVAVGCEQIHAPTGAVLPSPLKWLDWIEQYRATITWAPNFAYGLVNEAVEEARKEKGGVKRDLSSLRFILNGGEAIVSKTARRFLELLAEEGLPGSAMRPAWGMSETSSGVTSSDQFRLETTRDEDSFVEVGGPLPGTTLRILGQDGQVVEEGKIGSLQIKGPTVTAGYYQMPEQNRESFTEDGWFKTGDLALIREGRLTITGREKDVIIINGINYYSHEVEAVVEAVAGVEVSYTAACAIRAEGENTDQLAVFFHTEREGEERAALLQEVRGVITRKAGVSPDYVVVVRKEQVPKTGIGKIQRTQLRDRFMAGEFAGQTDQAKPAPGNDDWSYRMVWRERERPEKKNTASGHAVIITTSQTQAKGEELIAGLKTQGVSGEILKEGEAISPQATMVAIWDRVEPVAAPDEPFAMQQAVMERIETVLEVVRALQERDNVQLYWVTEQSQGVQPADSVDLTAAPVRGILKTIPDEMSGVSASWIDVERGGDGIVQLAQEMTAWAGGGNPDREIAYRQGKRFVAGVEPMALAAPSTSPIRKEGIYLLTGGLGGIGTEVARSLLTEHQSCLIVVGRGAEEQLSAERAETLASLRALSEKVIYEKVDLTDLGQLRAVVQQAEKRWNQPLAGIFHLAGAYHEKALVEETAKDLEEVLTPKVAGAWALHRLMEEKPACILVSFSSLISAFGGYQTGAYAAANNFLDGLSVYQRNKGQRGYALLWSSWQDTGMSRGVEAGEALRARGYRMIGVKRGLESLYGALSGTETPILMGVDGSKPMVKGYLGKESQTAESGGTEYVAPRTETEKKMAQLWARLLKRERVGIRDNFFEIGGKSLLAARLFAQIDKAFGQSLPLATLFSFSTIEQLAALLEKKNEATTTASSGSACKVTPIRPDGLFPPLFCIPGAGSDAVAFRELALRLEPGQTFYGLQAPGLDAARTDLPFMTVEETATAFIQNMREVQRKGPYYLGGHCFGCLLAYEMARQLNAQSERVALLVLLDPIVSTTFSDGVVDQNRLVYHFGKFWKLTLGEKIRYAWTRLKNFQRTLVVRRRLAFSYQQASEMHRRYILMDYPGRVVVFLAKDSFYNLAPERDPRRVWSRLALDGVDYYEVEGDHHTILHGAEVAGVAKQLNAVLTGARGYLDKVHSDTKVSAALGQPRGATRKLI